VKYLCDALYDISFWSQATKVCVEIKITKLGLFWKQIQLIEYKKYQILSIFFLNLEKNHHKMNIFYWKHFKLSKHLDTDQNFNKKTHIR